MGKYIVVGVCQLLSFLVAGGFFFIAFLASGNLPTHSAQASQTFDRALMGLLVWAASLVTSIVLLTKGMPKEAMICSGLSIAVAIAVVLWAL